MTVSESPDTAATKSVAAAEEALAPCPFCGGKPSISVDGGRVGTARQSMIVVCTHCGALMESGDVWGLTPMAEWSWNRRWIIHTAEPAPSPAMSKADAALVAELQKLERWYGGKETDKAVVTVGPKTPLAKTLRKVIARLQAAPPERKP